MRHGFITIFILLFACIVNTTAAQQYIFKNYTVNDGLVANSVRRIFQDSKGFLWIATVEGLSKYDGHKFTNFTTANGLSHSQVNDFYESKDGKLFVALNKEIINCIYEDKITYEKLPATTIVNRFFVSPLQKVIVSTDDNGLQEFNNGKLLKPSQPFSASSFFDFTPLNDSLFIAVSPNAIRVFNYNYELFAEITAASDIYIDVKIYQDSKSRIFACTYSGVKMLAIPAQKNQPLAFAPLPAHFNIPALQKNWVTDVMEDNRGVLWFGTVAGLVKVNPDGTHQLLTKKNGLISESITCLFQDSEKNIWIATSLGLSKLVTQSAVSVYTTEDGLWQNNLFFVSPFKKNLLLAGSPKGVQVFNTQTKQFASSAASRQQVFYGAAPYSKPPLLYGADVAVIVDTLTGGFKKIINFPQNQVWFIITDKQGNFFLCDDNKRIFFYSEKHNQSILSYRGTCLLPDKKNYLWAGTWENGLWRIKYNYDENGLHILSKEQYLPDENIRSLFEDSNGTIWAGTRYHGVYQIKINESGKAIITNFDQNKGLTSNFVKAIAEDRNGNLWLAFYQGLDKLICRDTSYRVFNFSRVNNYFASISNINVDTDNSLWLATAEGMAQIKDGEMEKLPALPVYITKVYSSDSIYGAEESKLNLNYRHNQLQFEFSSPGFINEKQVLYSYRLLGSSSEEWTHPANEHSVSYASLQPGHYIFEVRSIGWDGIAGNPDSFKFSIAPPFWQTWWFRVCAAILISGLVFVFVRRRIITIRHEADMQQKLASTEMAALRAQMNPHFIFNSLNSIENFIMQNEKRLASDYLNKFARLIRMILDSSRNELVPVAKDMETLQLYIDLEQLRFDNKFSYKTFVDPALLSGDYRVPSLLIQPYVENAIVHGLAHSEGKDLNLTVTASLENDKIKYVIQDNGVGREKAGAYNLHNKPQHKSVGLKITEERINIFNGEVAGNGSVKFTDLYDGQENPAGTKAEITIKAT